jgi:hypothetical protein
MQKAKLRMKNESRLARCLSFCILHSAFCICPAADLDPGKLPPPAKVQIEFDRDIKPIFESTCIRCHGPERPKSHFRLDNRDSALKGGDNGVDILPGDSAKSPLIHYVARLVEDMEMPPPGKGEPLTPEQVGLLRAWIDQGANWGTPSQAGVDFTIVPALRWISVDGDKTKFREVEGIREGFSSGLEHFSITEQVAPDKRVSIEGRALFPDNDIQLKLAVEKTDLGFVRAGFEHWRRYYDDTGGYHPAYAVPSFDSNSDLHLDIGRAWIDFGLTLPHLPQIVLGYEYHFKEGSKSMLEWGPVIWSGVRTNNFYPAAKNIDEDVHVVKLDVTHEIGGWRLEDRARVEFYELGTREINAVSASIGPGADTIIRTRQGADHVQGMNTVRAERQVTDWWLLSGGYLYSKLDGDASFKQTTMNAAGVPSFGQFWSSDDLVLKRESHIFSLTSLLLPMNGLSLSLGLQNEWQRQEGAGDVHLDHGDPLFLDNYDLTPGTVRSDLDTMRLVENIELRFMKIPFTVLFAEGRFDQEAIGQFERGHAEETSAGDDTHESFLRDTDASNNRYEGRFGFNMSPWRWVSFNAHYKHRLSDTEYDHNRDFEPDTSMLPNPGYSAFISEREIETDEVQAKLVVRPANWLKLSFTYQLLASDFSSTTDPVPGGTHDEGIHAADYDAHVYGLNVVLTPFQRFYFSGTFTYSDTRLETPASGVPAVVPYDGDVYSIVASANYSLNNAAALQAAYSFSQANYGRNNFGDAIPLGLDYTRHGLMVGVTLRLSDNVSTNLRYGYYDYSEPSTGGFNDYTAHGVFATIVMKWP